jgi:hypothetical protein
MKELYGLAEVHWPLEDLYARTVENGETYEVLEYFWKGLNKIYEERKRRVRNFLQKYKPKVLFCEGSSSSELRNPTTLVKVIWLDDHSESYKRFMRGLGSIHSRYEPLLEKLIRSASSWEDKAELQGIAKKLEILEARKEEEISRYEIENWNLITVKREKEWAETILENYEFPSCIIAGAYHFIGDLKNELKLLINSTRSRVFYSVVVSLLDRHKNLNKTLTYFLKRGGIKLKVTDCLFVL